MFEELLNLWVWGGSRHFFFHFREIATDFLKKATGVVVVFIVNPQKLKKPADKIKFADTYLYSYHYVFRFILGFVCTLFNGCEIHGVLY